MTDDTEKLLPEADAIMRRIREVERSAERLRSYAAAFDRIQKFRNDNSTLKVEIASYGPRGGQNTIFAGSEITVEHNQEIIGAIVMFLAEKVKELGQEVSDKAKEI